MINTTLQGYKPAGLTRFSSILWTPDDGYLLAKAVDEARLGIRLSPGVAQLRPTHLTLRLATRAQFQSLVEQLIVEGLSPKVLP